MTAGLASWKNSDYADNLGNKRIWFGGQINRETFFKKQRLPIYLLYLTEYNSVNEEQNQRTNILIQFHWFQLELGENDLC